MPVWCLERSLMLWRRRNSGSCSIVLEFARMLDGLA
jgi:hypothetical protein